MFFSGTLKHTFQAAFNTPSGKLQRLLALYKCFYLLTYLLTNKR